MTKQEFVTRFPQFTQGMTVRSRNGEKLGTVLTSREKDLIIEKGFFFPRDYVVTFDQVESVQHGDVLLKRHSEELVSEIRDGELIPGQALESATPREPETNVHPKLQDRVA